MQIQKCENGLCKVSLKNVSEPFYVTSEKIAIEIAWKLGGGKNE